jgi:hypothetical protein
MYRSLHDVSRIKRDHPYCRFAKNNVMRVYPFGLRFDSSNLDPTKAWAYGAQLAAINMQVLFKDLRFLRLSIYNLLESRLSWSFS